MDRRPCLLENSLEATVGIELLSRRGAAPPSCVLAASMLPLYCRPIAFEHFRGQLSRIDTPDGLAHCAVAIAMHELPEVDPQCTIDRLGRMGAKVRRRVRGRNPHAMLAHLHDVLFEEEGFRGNECDYYHPDNSYLPRVIRTKRGLPISLTLIYKFVGQKVGLQISGVNAPGHFLARVENCDGAMYVDPFDGGRVLNLGEVYERIAATAGQKLEPRSELLRCATHRQWIARMLNNLQAIFAFRGRMQDLAAMQELQHLL